MRDYTILFNVNGTFEVEVKANSEKQALEQGIKIVEDADFGELRDIEWNDGKIIDY